MKASIFASILFCLIFASCNNEIKKENQETNEQTTEIDGVKMFEFNNFQLIAIQDGENPMPAALFEDADTNLLKELIPSGQAEASVNVFLLKKDGKTILFDTGNGEKRGGKLFGKLKELNINTDEISDIMLTHLHPDHIGGLLHNDSIAFKNAKIHISNTELNWWLSSNAPQEINGMVKQIVNAYEKQITTFNFGDTLPCGILALEAIGHTVGHTIFEFDNILILGDLLHAKAIQISHPELCPKYDMDKNKSVETRIKFYNYAADNKKFVAGMHLPFPGIIEDFSKIWNKKK